MKALYGMSAALLAFSGGLSAYLFANPVEEAFAPHWAIPLVGLICFLILVSAERGPKPRNPEKGFWAVLLCTPILGILFQLHYLSHISWLSIFQNAMIPIVGLHVLMALIGNYITTSKSVLSGIPTPWNLRSKKSWRKSHRLGGYGMVVIGVIGGIAAIITGEYQDEFLGFSLLGLLIVFTIYSWWVWRNDPDNEPLFGTV